MIRHRLHRLRIIVIHFIDALFIFVLLRSVYASLFEGDFSNKRAVVGVVGDALCNHILSTLNGRFDILHALLDIHKNRRLFFRRLGRILRKKQLCQRLQPLFSGNGSSGFALRTVRQIEIVDRHHRLSRHDFIPQFLCQLSLFFNGF